MIHEYNVGDILQVGLMAIDSGDIFAMSRSQNERDIFIVAGIKRYDNRVVVVFPFRSDAKIEITSVTLIELLDKKIS